MPCDVSLTPDRTYFLELLRPWKVVTFMIAMCGLLYGALTLDVCDWDVGVTLLIGSLTYVCAPWTVAMIWPARRPSSRRRMRVACALFVTWFVVDAAYVAYSTTVGNVMLRVENLWASTPIYFLAGVVWLPRLSLSEMASAARCAICARRR